MGAIGRRIVTREYRPGLVPPLVQVFCKELGIRPAPLREAMKRLHAKSLISVAPKRWIKVLLMERWNQLDPCLLMWRFETRIDLDLIDQLHELRQAFEPESCRLAAFHASPSQITAISEACDSIAALPLTPTLVVKSDIAFHTAILNATQNMFLISIDTVVNAAVQFQLGWVTRSFLSRSLICTGKTGMSFGVGMVNGPGKRCAA
jgi:DNA-binding FadR family transcriptional regulator